MKTAQLSPLNDLLDRLCSGDADAAAQVFLEYEPYLRKVVRRLLPARLRRKFDSLDIVQSAWSDLLQGFQDAGWRFTSAAQLRAFLVKVTRNRFLDRLRQQSVAVAREAPLADTSLQLLPSPSAHTPSQHVQAIDLWQRMVALCPAEYHPILFLKRRGLSPNEIAAETGLHPGSIRRILRKLAADVAAERFESQENSASNCG